MKAFNLMPLKPAKKNQAPMMIFLIVLMVLPFRVYSSGEMPSMIDHSQMNHSQMNHSQMNQNKVDESETMPSDQADKKVDHSQMDHSNINHEQMNHGSMPSQAPANARSDDYSQGLPSNHAGMMHNPKVLGVSFETLEWTQDQNQTDKLATEGELWYGGDSNRGVFTWDTSGESGPEDTELSLAWRRPHTAYWNTNIGVLTQLSQEQSTRTWAMLGMNGLIPYFIDAEGALLVSTDSMLGLTGKLNYDWRLTQEWVIEPEIKITAYNRTREHDHRGAGLSEGSWGLRLRYEIERNFAPYVGIEQSRKLGVTAKDYAKRGHERFDTSLLVGIKWWF